MSAITVSGYGPNSRLMLSVRINWSRNWSPNWRRWKNGSRTSRRSWARNPAIPPYLPRRILPVRRSVQAGSPVASRGGYTILPPDFRRASCWMSFIIIPRPARGAGVLCQRWVVKLSCAAGCIRWKDGSAACCGRGGRVPRGRPPSSAPICCGSRSRCGHSSAGRGWTQLTTMRSGPFELWSCGGKSHLAAIVKKATVSSSGSWPWHKRWNCRARPCSSSSATQSPHWEMEKPRLHSLRRWTVTRLFLRPFCANTNLHHPERKSLPMLRLLTLPHGFGNHR